MRVKGDLVLKGDLKIEEDLIVKGNIRCEGGDWNIKARDIEARNIEARNIEARNIEAWNIEARDIEARNISYYAFCIAYCSLKCRSIKGRRDNSFHKCLDGEIKIIKKEKLKHE